MRVKTLIATVCSGLMIQGAAFAAPTSDPDVVTKRFTDAWTTDNGTSIDIVAAIDPNDNFAGRLDKSKSQYGIGGGWFHKSIYSGQAEITYEFRDNATDNPITLDTFAIEISDIDAGNGNGFSQEVFRTNNVDRVDTLPNGVIQTEILDGARGRVKIVSTGNLDGSPKNSALLSFSDKSAFTLDYEALGGWQHANYWFTNGGGISLVDPMAERYSGFETAANPVPVPGTLALFGAGVLGLGVWLRRGRFGSRVTG